MLVLFFNIFIKFIFYVIINTIIIIHLKNISGDRRITMNFKTIVIFTFIIILMGLQHTLNKILLELREIKQILKGKS